MFDEIVRSMIVMVLRWSCSGESKNGTTLSQVEGFLLAAVRQAQSRRRKAVSRDRVKADQQLRGCDGRF